MYLHFGDNTFALTRRALLDVLDILSTGSATMRTQFLFSMRCTNFFAEVKITKGDNKRELEVLTFGHASLLPLTPSIAEEIEKASEWIPSSVAWCERDHE